MKSKKEHLLTQIMEEAADFVQELVNVPNPHQQKAIPSPDLNPAQHTSNIEAGNLDYQTHAMGAVPHERGVHFRVWAPNAQAVWVTGNFNGWRADATPMRPQADGQWAINVPNAKAGDEYKFVIRNGDLVLHRNDPYAKEVTHSVGNSVVVDPAFDWGNDHEFAMPSHNDLVIYELHIGTFNRTTGQHTGTFWSAIKRLDYLQWLGVNAVEVMPPFEFAGDLSWGYNPAHPFAIETAYGGPQAFKTFVKEAHKRGIAVILDVVYNHFGPSDLDLWQFDGWSENGKGGIYFYNDWRSQTPWGDTRPDYGRPEVRRYLVENALMWLSEYRCDGLRMDMIPYIRNVHANGNPADNLDMGYQAIREINQAVRHHFPHKITIAEDMHTLEAVTADLSVNGLGYNSQWDAQFVHPMQEVLKTPSDDQRDMLKVERAFLFKYNNDAFQRVIYTESHDEVANGKARIVEDIAPGQDGENYYAEKRALLGIAMMMTAPGIPMLFQGQAILEDRWFEDTDAMDWSKLEKNKGFAQSVRDLIRLRRDFKGNATGLKSQNVDTLHLNNQAKVVAFHRHDGPADNPARSVVVVANFRNTDYDHYAINFPAAGAWRLVYDSGWEGYSDYNEGDTKANHLLAHATEHGAIGHVHLSPYGVLVYTKS